MNPTATRRSAVPVVFAGLQAPRRPDPVLRRAFLASIVASVALAFVPQARGELYLYQPFNYPPRSDVAAGSLSDPTGTLATSANRLHGSDGQLPSWEVAPLQTWGTSGTDMWVGWLQRRDRNTVGFQGLDVMRPTQSGASGIFFAGEPGFGAGDNTFVIGQAGNDDTVVSSGVPVVPNETAFLVVHFQFRDGNDLATLFVNPTPGAAEPAGGVTYSGLDMPVIKPYVELNAIGNGPLTLDFDELRIGSTYADVAPVTPEPGGLVAIGTMLLLAARRRRRAE